MENNALPTTFTSKTGKQILIRFPVPSDLEAMLTFANELTREDTYTTLTGKEQTLDEEKEYLEKLLKDIAEKKGTHVVAFDGDKLIASSGIMLQGKRKEDVGLLGIAILKAYRSEGIGRNLMEILFSLGKEMGLRRIVLEVYGENTIAQALYKKMGFQTAGNLPNHIWYKGKLMDELVMYKDL